MSRTSLLRLGLLGLIWGSVFLWIKITGDGFAPVQMVFARLALGALVLLVIVWSRGLRLPRGAALWGHLLVAAFLGNALPWTLFAWGERTASSSVAGVVNSTTPVWTLAVALLWGQEKRLGGWRALGLLLGFTGTVLVAAPWTAHTTSVSGVVAFAVGTISLGASFAYMGRFLAKRRLPPLTLAAGQLTAGTVLMLLALPFGGLDRIHPSAGSVLGLLVLGVVCTGLAYVLNFQLIVQEGAPIASTVTYLFPPVSVLLGAAVLGEPLGWPVLAGAALVLAAVYFVRRKPAVPAGAPEPGAASAPATPAAVPVAGAATGREPA
ncbi:DMT family transporter [Paractinoplanes ferrugineus]|uniref:Multidrug transporter n=1 Tax=Paractinoplanes ferrugineus TaxID=113564 RepID=A0A919J546_9ACTN|nr:DMT family transporter [Actinoplanes ferrugineus]GIE13183.1 multidrug transporter [Actinoplanes ferrugineus]